MEILSVQNCSRFYGRGALQIAALDHVSFTVNKGEFVAIVGPSGSGKSTLMHILGGVDQPSEGQVVVDGTVITDLKEVLLAVFRRRQVGLIYQFYNLIPVLTVEENITLPLRLDEASELARLMKYADRNDIPTETRAYEDAILAIYAALQKRRKHSDNTDLMVEINHIVNDYVEVQPQQEGMIASKRFDISDIDFGLLVKEFSKHKKQNLVMRDLQQLIQDRLNQMLITNPQRIDYLQRYQQIIAEYNGEQDRATIEKTFMELMDLANSMDEE